MGMSWYTEIVVPKLTHLVLTKSCSLPRVALRPGQRNNIWETSGSEKGIPGDLEETMGWHRVKGTLGCIAESHLALVCRTSRAPSSAWLHNPSIAQGRGPTKKCHREHVAGAVRQTWV